MYHHCYKYECNTNIYYVLKKYILQCWVSGSWGSGSTQIYMIKKPTAGKRHQQQQSLCERKELINWRKGINSCTSYRVKVINQLLTYQRIIVEPRIMWIKTCKLETTHALTCKSLNKDAHLYSWSRKSWGMLAWGNTALSGNSGPVEAMLLMQMDSKYTLHSFSTRLTQSGKVLTPGCCTCEIWGFHSNVTWK